MSRGMGVVKYCTAEGGSGYVTNPALPWLSSFDITQQAPVYDQDMAWMRESRPGTYTNYSRFGPPYSMDGGVLPPYWDVPVSVATDANGQPIPYQPGCNGLGAVDPGVFESRYGRSEPDESTCLQIQCGAISQAAAGMQLISDCANAGWTGARSCIDPACSPWRNRIPGCVQNSGPFGPPATLPANPVLLRSDLVAPMPSITGTARRGCEAVVSNCPSDLGSWIESNPWMAAGLALAAGYVLFGGKR
jgi:hypothetical protein